MKLLLRRILCGNRYTIGHLYVDGEYFCDTLENPCRTEKLKGETAIPCGQYEITLKVKSPRFGTNARYSFCGGCLPRLLDVPGFEGILIHIGNYPEDTQGCILVGRNTVKGAVMQSAETFRKLYGVLEKAGDRIFISVE